MTTESNMAERHPDGAHAPHAASPAPRNSFDAIVQLTLFGKTGAIVATVVALAAVYAVIGWLTPYYRNADMDLVVVSNALRLNDGRPQDYFDHPGFLSILTLSWWLEALHALRMVAIEKISALPVYPDPAFEGAITALVRAARAYTFTLTISFALIFYALIARIVSDWRIAALAFTAFAVSGGAAVHLHTVRTEMIAASCVVFALLLLISAANHATASRPLIIGLAAALCVLGLENKVHVLLMIAPLPVILLSFGVRGQRSAAYWQTLRQGRMGLAGIVIAAAALTALAWPVITAGFDPQNLAALGLSPLIAGRSGIYQALLTLWIAAGVVLYAKIWRVNAMETLATLGAIVAGGSAALLVLWLRYDPLNAAVVMNPLERMASFTLRHQIGDATGLQAIVAMVGVGVTEMIPQYSFVLKTTARPAVFLIWLAIAGIVVTWRRGDRQVAAQATLLLLTVAAIDMISVNRQLKSEYYILTDPLIIIAGALLLDRLPQLRGSRVTYAVGLTLLVAHVGISLSEPVKHALQKEIDTSVCVLDTDYLKDMTLPFCAEPKTPG